MKTRYGHDREWPLLGTFGNLKLVFFFTNVSCTSLPPCVFLSGDRCHDPGDHVLTNHQREGVPYDLISLISMDSLISSPL